jgi:hypothetical protein
MHVPIRQEPARLIGLFLLAARTGGPPDPVAHKGTLLAPSWRGQPFPLWIWLNLGLSPARFGSYVSLRRFLLSVIDATHDASAFTPSGIDSPDGVFR